jgi:DNA-binding NarL/FixJ family response regulator
MTQETIEREVEKPRRIDLSSYTRADTLGAIIACIGPEAAAKLIEECGGSRVYVPTSPGAQSNLAKIIPPDGLAKLVAEFGGTVLHITRAEDIERERRNADVIEARKNGATARQICKRFGLTERTVYRILQPKY